jgi:predicted secreted protein
MAALNGKNLQLSLGNAATPIESFTVIGTFRATQFQLAQEVVDASNRGSNAWRSVVGGTGLRSLRVSVEGVLQDNSIEDALRSVALGGSLRNYRLLFGNGDYVQGAFIISDYAQAGEVGDAQRLALILESAGTISFVAG